MIVFPRSQDSSDCARHDRGLYWSAEGRTERLPQNRQPFVQVLGKQIQPDTALSIVDSGAKVGGKKGQPFLEFFRGL